LKQEDKYLLTFISISAVLYIIEGLIPKPLPWIKIGIANISVVVAIHFFNLRFLIKLVIYRVILGSLLTASLFTPGFFLALTGGLASLLTMNIFYKTAHNYISPIGLSIVGGVTHIFTQLFIVYLFIIKDSTIFFMTPIILILGLLSGYIVGFLAYKIILNIQESKIITLNT